MPSSTIHFTPEFIKACETLWRDGFNKGINGEDDFPDFKSFFEDTKSKIKVKEDPSYEELEKLPFNPQKCEARVEKFGYAIQCTRSPFGSGCLCKTHQNMLDKLPEGKDIRYGRFNQPRPDVTLDKGEPIKWGPKKTRSNGKSDEKKPKLKVGEMRDFLSSRIPNTVFKDLKKKELTVLYLKELEKDNSSSSEEGENTPIDSPKKEQSEKPEEPEEPEEPVSDTEDDGTGTGLKLEPVKPNSVSEFKTLFNELGIDYSNLKGRPAYKQAYEDYLKEKEEEKTQPMSDDEEDDDELKEDNHTYDEITFEGIEYLEDEESAYIFDLKGKKVAKWNEDSDDFIWISEEAKTHHENTRS